MATKTEEFLQKSDIRTMKKDLQKLREADVFSESEKIIGEKENAAFFSKKAAGADSRTEKNHKENNSLFVEKMENNSAPPAGNEKVNQKIEEVSASIKSAASGFFGNKKKPDEKEKIKTDLEKGGTETEKQKIFLAKSQRAELENKISLINKKNKLALNEEKDKILTQKNIWQNNLNRLLEEDKTATEEGRRAIEKRKWRAEKELAEIEKKIAVINDSQKTTEAEEKEAIEKIKKIDTILEDVYSSVAKRIKEKKDDSNGGRVLKKFGGAEEDQRKVFLENIEKWASVDKKNN